MVTFVSLRGNDCQENLFSIKRDVQIFPRNMRMLKMAKKQENWQVVTI